MMSDLPPFDPKNAPYNLSTYWGRVCHFWRLVNPLSALTPDSQLQNDRVLIERARLGEVPDSPDTRKQLWDAKYRVDAVYHPDTGEKIPLVLRMAMFMPVNLPVTAGMLLTPPGAAQLFWQWVNQSYNAGFNYANRNGSVPMDFTSLGLSYAIATGTALSAAHFLGKVVTRMQQRLGGASGGGGIGLTLMTRGLPWLAVASAGSANVLAMRYKEAIDGVGLEDESGNPHGMSAIAGRKGLLQSTLTRVVLPVPILLIPPFILDALRSTKALGAAMARSKPVRVGVELGVIGVFLQCALPLAIASFPQRTTVDASMLEPQFANRVNPTTGAVIDKYYFNRGV